MKSSNDKNNNLFYDKIEGKNEKAVLILNNKLEENETGGLIIIRNFNKNINLPVFVKTDSGEIPHRQRRKKCLFELFKSKIQICNKIWVRKYYNI